MNYCFGEITKSPLSDEAFEETFREWDKNGDGKISKGQLKRIFQKSQNKWEFATLLTISTKVVVDGQTIEIPNYTVAKPQKSGAKTPVIYEKFI